MNDSQCKTTDQADVLWFVNCPWRGWSHLASRVVTVLLHCESLLISSIICLGSHGFAHPVKVNVRLVSFPLSGVQMAWLQTKIRRLPPCCPRPLLACVSPKLW